MMAKKKVRTREMWLTNDDGTGSPLLHIKEPVWNESAGLWYAAHQGYATPAEDFFYKKDLPKPGPDGICKARVTTEIL